MQNRKSKLSPFETVWGCGNVADNLTFQLADCPPLAGWDEHTDLPFTSPKVDHSITCLFLDYFRNQVGPYPGLKEFAMILMTLKII